MSAHTSGPWRPCRSHEEYDGPLFDIDPEEQAEYDDRPFVRVEAADGTVVASAHDLFTFSEANARLIAAAPDLLAAADEALSVLIGCCVPMTSVDDRAAMLHAQATLRAAIRAAEGGA